jgi:hypothetical protein
MIENPADRQAKESKAMVLKRKHEANILRKELFQKEGLAKREYAQRALLTATQNYKAKPTKKNYRFWQTAVIRAGR